MLVFSVALRFIAHLCSSALLFDFAGCDVLVFLVLLIGGGLGGMICSAFGSFGYGVCLLSFGWCRDRFVCELFCCWFVACMLRLVWVFLGLAVLCGWVFGS